MEDNLLIIFTIVGRQTVLIELVVHLECIMDDRTKFYRKFDLHGYTVSTLSSGN